jgi:hypothetical protein
MSMGSPDGLRSFDPLRIADLEYRMWVAYYLRRWTRLLVASARLLWLGFGTDLARILPGRAPRRRPPRGTLIRIYLGTFTPAGGVYPAAPPTIPRVIPALHSHPLM